LHGGLTNAPVWKKLLMMSSACYRCACYGLEFADTRLEMPSLPLAGVAKTIFWQMELPIAYDCLSNIRYLNGTQQTRNRSGMGFNSSD
jgi:hypothetical protein